MKRTYHILLWGVVLGLFGLALVVGPAEAKNLRSWDKIESGDDRFKVLEDFNDEAVLDKETQLVWEQSPSTTATDWFSATFDCHSKIVGGRGGWRLPTVEELMSLVDPTQSSPALPRGHPFDDVLPLFYWSATTNPRNATNARPVFLDNGTMGTGFLKSDTTHVWCVRGGQGHDGGFDP